MQRPSRFSRSGSSGSSGREGLDEYRKALRKGTRFLGPVNAARPDLNERDGGADRKDVLVKAKVSVVGVGEVGDDPLRLGFGEDLHAVRRAIDAVCEHHLLKAIEALLGRAEGFTQVAIDDFVCDGEECRRLVVGGGEGAAEAAVSVREAMRGRGRQ